MSISLSSGCPSAALRGSWVDVSPSLFLVVRAWGFPTEQRTCARRVNFICVELLSSSWMSVFSDKSSKYFEAARRMHKWFVDSVNLQPLLTNSSLVSKCVLSKSFLGVRQSCSKMVVLGPLGHQILSIFEESARPFDSNFRSVLRSCTSRISQCFLRLCRRVSSNRTRGVQRGRKVPGHSLFASRRSSAAFPWPATLSSFPRRWCGGETSPECTTDQSRR